MKQTASQERVSPRQTHHHATERELFVQRTLAATRNTNYIMRGNVISFVKGRTSLPPDQISGDKQPGDNQPGKSALKPKVAYIYYKLPAWKVEQ